MIILGVNQLLMIQKAYTFKTIEDFRAITQGIKDSDDFRTSKRCLLQLAVLKNTRSYIQEILDAVYADLPGACVIGLTNDSSTRLKDSLTDLCNVVFFEESEISIASYNFKNVTEEEAGRQLDARIKTLPFVRGILVFAAGIYRNINVFLDRASDNINNIPIFGANAGINTEGISRDNASAKPFVFAGDIYAENIHEDGAVVAILYGKDLHIRSVANIGWQPLGKELEITGTDGAMCATSIDDMPATYIYNMYLRVTPDKNFTQNVSEFPLLLTERYGIMQPRVPYKFDDDGKLYFSADVKKGERIRITYGNIRHILTETIQSSNQLYRFGAQALFLYASANREIFLKQAAQKELSYYRNVNREFFHCYGWGEILKFQTGGILNASCIAIAMHEGNVVHPEEDCNAPEALEPARLTMPLSTRLLSFLETTNKEMKESSEAKSNFLSNMSHEIRTPINAILGMDEMILREGREENVKNYALGIQRAGKMLLSLINDILDFSKIEANKLEIHPFEYDLAATITDLENMAYHSATAKNLNFIIDIAPDTPRKLFGDEDRIKQCILNIITNAIKYTKEGSVHLVVKSEKKAEDKILLKVEVTDTGIGIKPEDLRKLFTPFERIEESRNRNIEGTGLGMSIVKGLLSKMNSALSVKSEYGKGSTFSFSLEQKVTSWEPIGNYKKSQQNIINETEAYKESFQAPNAHLLVVDDMPTNLTVIRGLLKSTRIQIDTAENAFKGLEKANEKKYDTIILDHLMPGMDGIQMLHALRANKDSPNKDTTCIALTANAIMGAKDMYIKEGFEYYLSKPIDGSSLEETLLLTLPKDLILLPGDKDFVKEASPASKAKGTNSSSNGSLDSAQSAEMQKAFASTFNINIGEALKNCGSFDILKQAVASFCENLPAKIQELKDLLEKLKTKDESFAENIREYTVLTHGIKGSARLIGEEELSSLAQRLEKCGDSKTLEALEEIQKDTPLLIELCDKSIARLSILAGIAPQKPDAQNEAADTRPPLEEENLKESFEAIKEYAQAFDFNGTDSIIEMLDTYSLPQNYIEIYKKLKLLLQAGDRSATLELLEKV